MQNTDTLFNTYWIRVNHKGRTAQQCVEQTRVMFQAACEAGVRRIVHISITNPDTESDLPYFQGKGQLEDALRDLDGVSHAILRPTVLYSVEDILLNSTAWTGQVGLIQTPASSAKAPRAFEDYIVSTPPDGELEDIPGVTLTILVK